jgi:hypothetical protein
MFTGFASENTPAIKFWDFTAFYNGTTRIGLSDDCAPVQFFATGGTTTSINLLLPTAPTLGKIIKIVNSNAAFNNQNILITASDNTGNGAGTTLYSLGQNQILELCYINNYYSLGTTNTTGWFALNQGSAQSGGLLAIAFGFNNSAGATAGFIGGGSNNVVSSGNGAILGGNSNSINSQQSFIGGGVSNSTSGTNAVVLGGNNNVASGTGSGVFSGGYGTTRNITGMSVLPSSVNPVQTKAGASQSAVLVLGRQTTDATATRLTSNNVLAGDTTNQVILPNSSAYYVKGSVIATVTGGGNTKSWDFIATIKRGANAAATSIVGAVTLNVQAADAGAATWLVAITADTTNGGLAVTVTGQAATTIRWVAKLESTEVTY